MIVQEEVLTRCIEFYREFEYEFSQYDYDKDIYYNMLFSMGYALADDFELPPEMLIDFVKKVH